ncbi:MAG: hypothetical protein MUF32_06535 [Burkholderiaceae bacterium]|jgi:hypothetical protein|nr:hypothetical protein [Burkholderiaceae bacterium]
MNPDLTTPPPLSLQDKLDRIAYERDVLALRQELARHGLREGDAVMADGGARGRLTISRGDAAPGLRVLTDEGVLADFSFAHWRRDCRP